LRRDIAPAAPALLAEIDRMLAQSNGNGLGNRGTGYRLSVEGFPELFVRKSRRGGLMRRVIKDLYFGRTPRQVRELATAAEVHRRGIPVAEPIGAAAEWVLPGVYRGMFFTRALSGMTLWEFVTTDDDPVVRHHVLKLARWTIDAMHEKGLFHN